MSLADSELLARLRDPDPRALAAHSLAELEPLARARMAPSAWDYVEGGAWDEISLAENVEAWRAVRLRPRVLVDVGRVDPATDFLGERAALPVGVAPMAAHGLAHPDGELATARAAAAAGIPFTLSTMASRSIEEVATATPGACRWFQLYTQAQPGHSRRLVERAAGAGYRAIMVTVDLPVLGYRERDLRNGFDLAVPLGNFEGGRVADGAGGLGGLDGPADRTISWADVAEIATWSPLPLVLKGILTAEDARRAVEAGAAGIVVSNHGARQLDRTVTPLAALPEVVAAVAGRSEVWVDGGVRRGLDVAIACALGARGVLVGRPFLWGIAAAGEAGAARVLAILRDELERAMALLGAPSVADLVPAMVRPTPPGLS